MVDRNEILEEIRLLNTDREYIKDYISHVSENFFIKKEKDKINEEIDNDFDSMILFFTVLNEESRNYGDKVKECYEWYRCACKLINEIKQKKHKDDIPDKVLNLNLLECNLIDCFRNDFFIDGNVHGILDKETRDGIVKEAEGKDRPVITDEENKETAEEKKVKEEKIDMVNHPPHYQICPGLEVIDIIDNVTEWLGLTGKEAYHYTQLLGYILRYKKKNGKEDLEKARFFLNRMIDKYDEYNKKGD